MKKDDPYIPMGTDCTETTGQRGTGNSQIGTRHTRINWETIAVLLKLLLLLLSSSSSSFLGYLTGFFFFFYGATARSRALDSFK
jgi:hypothetical protein